MGADLDWSRPRARNLVKKGRRMPVCRLPILLLFCILPLLISALGEEINHEVEASSAELQAAIVKREAGNNCKGGKCDKNKKKKKKRRNGTKKGNRRNSKNRTKKGRRRAPVKNDQSPEKTTKRKTKKS